MAKNGYKEEVITEEELAMVQLNVERTKDLSCISGAAQLYLSGQPVHPIFFHRKLAGRCHVRPLGFSKDQEDRALLSWSEDRAFNFQWQSEDEANQMHLFVDSDWAGCAVTRRSTSGGLLKLGMHTLKTWSSTTAVVAMSSAEAELYAMTEGAIRGM